MHLKGMFIQNSILLLVLLSTVRCDNLLQNCHLPPFFCDENVRDEGRAFNVSYKFIDTTFEKCYDLGVDACHPTKVCDQEWILYAIVPDNLYILTFPFVDEMGIYCDNKVAFSKDVKAWTVITIDDTRTLIKGLLCLKYDCVPGDGLWSSGIQYPSYITKRL